MNKLQLSIFCLSILIHNAVHSQLTKYHSGGCESESEYADKVSCTAAYCGPFGCPDTATTSTAITACTQQQYTLGSSSCSCNGDFVWEDIHKLCVSTCDAASCGTNGKCVKGASSRGSAPRCLCNAGFTQLLPYGPCVSQLAAADCQSPNRALLTDTGTVVCACPAGQTKIASSGACVNFAEVTCDNYESFACKSKKTNDIDGGNGNGNGNGNDCGCAAGYVMVEGRCVPIPKCTCEDKNAECLELIDGTERCTCNAGFFDYKGTCYALPTEEKCKDPKEIVTFNEDKKDFWCRCQENYWHDHDGKGPCVEIPEPK